MLTRLGVYGKLVAMPSRRRQMACSSCSISGVSIGISHSRDHRAVYEVLRASVVIAYICLALQKAQQLQRNRATLRTVSELLTLSQLDKIMLAIYTLCRYALLHVGIQYTDVSAILKCRLTDQTTLLQNMLCFA